MKCSKLFYTLKHLNYNFPIRNSSNIKISKSFVISVFEGKIDTTQIFPYPKVLSHEQEETVQQMVGPITKFFEEMNNASKNDEMETIEPKSSKVLKELGMYGLVTKEQYGGIGLNAVQSARLIEILGSHDLGVTLSPGSHQGIGYKGIVLFGTEEQKNKYLPSLVSGEKLASFCLTESCSGSDANSIQSRAVKSSDGSHYILNGSKIWITNAGISDIFTVFAKTSIANKEGIEKDAITAFIVERGFGGITNGLPEKKMGIKCSNTASLFFENCKIPIENVIGVEGNGFKVAMKILNDGRFAVGAALTGTMKTCIQKASIHASERTQFGNKIHTYGSIQEKLARMAVKHYVTESMVYAVAGNMVRGVEEFQIEAAISKVYGSEAAWFCCDEAIQIMGGMGYMKECGLERIMRDLRVFRIFEGTSEILRIFLMGQGMIQLSKKLQNSDKITILTNEVMKKIGFNRKIDSLNLDKVVHKRLHSSARKLVHCAGLFSSNVQSLLIKHKKNVTNQQFHLKRLADCIMEIYGMGTVLSRATSALNNNEPTGEYQANLATLACSLASEVVQESIHSMKIHGDETFQNMSLISNEICKFGGVIQPNPLGF